MMQKPPNLVIFNPDQWRGDVMGHLGDSGAVTPNLDRLVESDAVSFRNAFCQNPVCTPSRCSFMSGWYPHVAGHRTQSHMLREHEPNLLRTLKDSGYYVWWGGKNDLVPAQRENPWAPYCHVKNKAEATRRWMHDSLLYGNARGEPGGDSYHSFFIGKIDVKDPATWYNYIPPRSASTKASIGT
ncbi:MAG: sulfatase-like hydrolase/transferase [Chitinivibrionales bacterium]|nr:sulfatase-like hydrolase/transferase [Chitinivibrionales bacterium]MBD3355961.1 sulfatase-like hydrolase/transferase [Chitinivibrionales bacterium]